jgi:general secretion pathway protein F
MREFAYRAYDAEGRMVDGRLAAMNESDLLDQLHVRGLAPFASTEIRPGGRRRASAGGRLRRSELSLLFRDVTALIEAALPIDQALRLAAAQAGSSGRKAVLDALHEAMVGGASLAAAMEAREDVFAAHQVAAVRAGELTGDLAAVLKGIAADLDRETELRGRIAGAFVYPGILVGVALFALALVLAVMVPALVPLFEGQTADMPLILVAATRASDLFANHGASIAFAAAVIGVAATAFSRTERFREARDRFVLSAPMVGPLARGAATARFARTFGGLLRSGTPLPKALDITATAARSRSFRADLSRAAEELKGGARLADVLSGLEILSDSSRSLILVGERTNRLAEMMVRVAEMNEKDLGRGIDRLMTILTPALTVGIGALVGGLVVSVMTAILGANELAF